MNGDLNVGLDRPAGAILATEELATHAGDGVRAAGTSERGPRSLQPGRVAVGEAGEVRLAGVRAQSVVATGVVVGVRDEAGLSETAVVLGPADDLLPPEAAKRGVLELFGVRVVLAEGAGDLDEIGSCGDGVLSTKCEVSKSHLWLMSGATRVLQESCQVCGCGSSGNS
jgi:hypothetical protein